MDDYQFPPSGGPGLGSGGLPGFSGEELEERRREEEESQAIASTESRPEEISAEELPEDLSVVESDAYFTTADAIIQLVSHPEPEFNGEPLNAAYFRFTAGDTPQHMFNYARRQTPIRAHDVGKGHQGGAPFDDTAISNRLVSMELVMNMPRFRAVRSRFQAMTHIGDVLVGYKGITWEKPQGELQGYLLVGGHVEAVGYEVTVRSATFPAVRLQFDDIRPVIDGRRVTISGSPTARRPQSTDDIITGQRTLVGVYDFEYKLPSGTTKTYHPSFVETPGEAPYEAGSEKVSEYPDQEEIIVSSESGFLSELGFVGAIVRLSSAQVYVWDYDSESYKRADIGLEGGFSEEETQAVAQSLFSLND